MVGTAITPLTRPKAVRILTNEDMIDGKVMCLDPQLFYDFMDLLGTLYLEVLQ